MSDFKLFQEFLTEGKDDGSGKIDKDHASVIPNGHWFKHASAYDHYRLLIAAAATDGKTTPENFQPYGPYGEHPFSSAYTQHEQDILNIAKKMCGIDSKAVAKGPSSEPDHIHRVSPVHPKPHKTSWRKPAKD